MSFPTSKLRPFSQQFLTQSSQLIMLRKQGWQLRYLQFFRGATDKPQLRRQTTRTAICRMTFPIPGTHTSRPRAIRTAFRGDMFLRCFYSGVILIRPVGFLISIGSVSRCTRSFVTVPSSPGPATNNVTYRCRKQQLMILLVVADAGRMISKVAPGADFAWGDLLSLLRLHSEYKRRF